MPEKTTRKAPAPLSEAKVTACVAVANEQLDRLQESIDATRRKLAKLEESRQGVYLYQAAEFVATAGSYATDLAGYLKDTAKAQRKGEECDPVASMRRMGMSEAEIAAEVEAARQAEAQGLPLEVEDD